MGKFLKSAVASVVAAGTLASSAAVAAADEHKPHPSKTTIAGLVAASGGEFDHNGRDHDLLLNAVKAAGLVGALDDPGADFNVFAPDDRAFIDQVLAETRMRRLVLQRVREHFRVPPLGEGHAG